MPRGKAFPPLTREHAHQALALLLHDAQQLPPMRRALEKAGGYMATIPARWPHIFCQLGPEPAFYLRLCRLLPGHAWRPTLSLLIDAILCPG